MDFYRVKWLKKLMWFNIAYYVVGLKKNSIGFLGDVQQQQQCLSPKIWGWLWILDRLFDVRRKKIYVSNPPNIFVSLGFLYVFLPYCHLFGIQKNQKTLKMLVCSSLLRFHSDTLLNYLLWIIFILVKSPFPLNYSFDLAFLNFIGSVKPKSLFIPCGR